MKIEKRFIDFKLQNVISETETESNNLTGYAALFNSETDIGGAFTEVIRAGSFARAISEKHDVRALIDHKPELILGRTSANTLQLTEDAKGLKVDIQLPNTTIAQDLKENIKLGNISQMSFGFYVRSENWTERQDGSYLREILDLDLFDVSVVTFPAYENTEISLRNLKHEVPQELTELKIEKENKLLLQSQIAKSFQVK